MKLEMGATPERGRGVFAGQVIRKGQVIKVLTGEILDVNKVWELVLLGKLGVDYPLQIGRRKHMVLDTFSALFNHSCDPNAGIRKKSELFALRNIEHGEEITFDYSLTCSPTNSWKMKCKCRATICRAVVGDILTVSRERLEYYRELGALQDYMKRLLPNILQNRTLVAIYDEKAIKKWRTKPV